MDTVVHTCNEDVSGVDTVDTDPSSDPGQNEVGDDTRDKPRPHPHLHTHHVTLSANQECYLLKKYVRSIKMIFPYHHDHVYYKT